MLFVVALAQSQMGEDEISGVCKTAVSNHLVVLIAIIEQLYTFQNWFKQSEKAILTPWHYVFF